MPASPSGLTDSETAYAKINLALHVRRRLPNGYHDLETIFAFLDKGDRISVHEGKDVTLAIEGPFSHGLSGSDNLVIAATVLLAKISGTPKGARLHLDKQLPVASGIGGGSADAAATLRLLNRFWALGLSVAELADISKPLGADVPACVASQTCRGTGIGQDLEPMPENNAQGCGALLINPLVSVSTAEIFAAWDGVDRGALDGDDVLSIAGNGRNDLQAPALAQVPQLANVLHLLSECQPLVSRMSGSGATCFALFATVEEAEAAERHCRKTMAGIWTLTGKIR